MSGNVEKCHQRRSRTFAVLTYWKYALRVKMAVALLDDCFDHSRQLLIPKYFRRKCGLFSKNIQQAMSGFSLLEPSVMRFRLVRILVAVFFLLGSGCALGTDVVPETLQSQVDSSVTFPKMLENPENYQGTVVILGGEVLSAKRLQEGTRLELLQLPLDGSNEPVRDRTNSQGRFLAVESSFLDPATLPPNTRVTLVGEVAGVTEANLDEMSYHYPTLAIKHLHVWPESEFDQPESSGPSFGIFGEGSSGGRVGGGVSIGIGF